MAVKATLNAGEWVGFLSAMNSKIKNPSELLKTAFMVSGFKDIIQHFDDEKGPMGKWKARSPETQMQYAMRGRKDSRYNPSNKILQLTGNLRKSILPSNVKKLSRNAVEIYANSEYGHRHDSGTDGMPQREFMWFSDSAKDKMSQIISSLVFGF